MLRNKKGFTLIELMIVIAIIGILAAIAIPNFKAHQARQRAKQAQVELQERRKQAQQQKQYDASGATVQKGNFKPL